MKKLSLVQLAEKRENAIKELLKVEREIFEEETNYLQKLQAGKSLPKGWEVMRRPPTAKVYQAGRQAAFSREERIFSKSNLLFHSQKEADGSYSSHQDFIQKRKGPSAIAKKHRLSAKTGKVKGGKNTKKKDAGYDDSQDLNDDSPRDSSMS